MALKRKLRRFKKQYRRLTCIQKFEHNWGIFAIRMLCKKQ
jgi:hypothetical protein